MNLDDFPEVRKTILNFAGEVNASDFYYFVYSYNKTFGNLVIPVFLKIICPNSGYVVDSIQKLQFDEMVLECPPDIRISKMGAAIYCWLKDTAPLKYSNNTEQNGRRQKVVKIEFVGNVSSKVQGYVLREIEKQYSVELSDKYETTFDVEMEYSTYYMNYNLNRSVKIRLSFEPNEKQNKLIFTWKKHASAYSAEYENGIKLRSLGFVTLDPEAAKSLKSFNREVDGSYGNPKIATRMKKYLNL